MLNGYLSIGYQVNNQFFLNLVHVASQSEYEVGSL